MTKTPIELEEWKGVPGKALHIRALVDLAFDYRGNVTVVRSDGSWIVGYLFNKDHDSTTPSVQMFDEDGNGPISLSYGEIQQIIFSGKDPAKGNSYRDYLKRKQNRKAPPHD